MKFGGNIKYSLAFSAFLESMQYDIKTKIKPLCLCCLPTKEMSSIET